MRQATLASGQATHLLNLQLQQEGVLPLQRLGSPGLAGRDLDQVLAHAPVPWLHSHSQVLQGQVHSDSFHRVQQLNPPRVVGDALDAQEHVIVRLEGFVGQGEGIARRCTAHGGTGPPRGQHVHCGNCSAAPRNTSSQHPAVSVLSVGVLWINANKCKLHTGGVYEIVNCNEGRVTRPGRVHYCLLCSSRSSADGAMVSSSASSVSSASCFTLPA